MHGQPLVRLIFVVIALALTGVAVWRLTAVPTVAPIQSGSATSPAHQG